MKYHEKMVTLLGILLQALASTVPYQLPKEKMKEVMTNAEATLRLLHYPPKDPNVENQYGGKSKASSLVFGTLYIRFGSRSPRG
jgi:isopenicillin N synthase-like dioxygenase